MKSKRNYSIIIVVFMLILFCAVLLVACGSESYNNNVVTNEAEYTITDEANLATSQYTTVLNKRDSKKSASTSSSSKRTGIYIGGGEITSDRSHGGGWSYDFNSNTLTLNGYYSSTSLNNTLGLTKAIFPDVKNQTSQAHIAIDSTMCTSLTIKVKGEYATCFGEIDDADNYDKDNYTYYGIYAPGVDLIMDIEDDYAPMKYNPTYYPLQIYTHRDAVYCKNLTITGGGGLRADSCIGSGINCENLSVNHSRLICHTEHGNNIYHGIIGHSGTALLATGSVTFTGGSADIFVQNTAPKVGSIWGAYQIDVYGIKTGSLTVKSGAVVNVNMSFSEAVTQNVSFKATGIYASNCTSYDGGKLVTKISANDSIPDDAYLCGCYIEEYTYYLGGTTTITGELSKPSSKSFKLDSFMNNFPIPGGSMSTSIEDTKYNYTANINALYLRNNDGTLQYASNYLFNNPTTLSSNEIDMADFSDIGNNVYSVSGDWKIKPIAGDYNSTFVALDDSISLEMSGGNTYNSFNLYTYTGATIYLSGDGIVNSLSADGCNEKGVSRFISYGSINFQSGTVKSGSANSGCNVIFYDGNINIDYEDAPPSKWTFDFGEYADLVNFQTDLTFSVNSSDRIGLYPIDGKLYSWDNYQTTGTLYRLFKYAVVRPSDGYMYYLYPKAADTAGTFSMQRLTETDVFIESSDIDGKYYLADGDTLTLSSGVFGKQVTRPATTFGDSSSTEILAGSTTTIIPDGFTVKWYRTDREGNTTQIGSGLSLSAQVKALNDDGSVYTCSILQGSTEIKKIEVSVFVFDYNSVGLAPKLAGKNETIHFTFSFDSFKGHNDWIADNYNFIWQKDADGSGTFLDIAGTENQTALPVTIESDDSYKALYRVRCYSNNYYVSGSVMKSYPTFYTTTTNPTFRELPSFSGELRISPSNDNYVGATKYYSISLENCFAGAVDVWYEYSADDGETWDRALNNSAFENGIDIILNSIYISPYGSSVTDSKYASKSLNAHLSTEMNGWKLRCVMQSGEYVVRSNEIVLTVLDFAEFTSQPENTVVITSSEPLSLSASFDENYTDEDGNGISDITYQWLYETWSNGNYDKVDTANPITKNTLYFEDVSGIGSVSRYRLQVKFKYKEIEYIRYSDYAYVYILYPPVFDDEGVVIDNMADGIYSESDSVSWDVKDNGVNYHYYKTYQFEVSKDGGNTWQSVGESFTQSYKNTTFNFSLPSLSVADGGLYRLKVSIEKYDVTVCSYSNSVNVGVVSSLSTDGDPQSYASTKDGKLILSAKHEYSDNLSVVYQWQGYKSALGWIDLTEENYFDIDKQAMYAFGEALSSYEKYRCLVNYNLNDDVNVSAYTNEVTPILIVTPDISALPVDQTVWLGNSIRFMLWVNNTTENYTVLWEISNDGGETWKNAVDVKQGETGETDYSLFCPKTTLDMDGAMFRCIVINAIGDVSESIVTDPVTLTVKSGYVKSEQEFLDALKNGMTEFKLLNDIDLTATLIIENDITLDLNGHILNYQNQLSGSVIKVINNATLTITDSMPEAVHTDDTLPLGGIISGGTGSVLSEEDTNTYGGGILIEKGTLIIIGGTIYNCNATYGGGIYVSDSSHLSLEGGTIANGSAKVGGGIYSEGNIDIKDGNISNCSSNSEDESNDSSDALYLKGSTLNAIGGTIDGTVMLEDSLITLPDGSDDSTIFSQTVYCDNSTIKGGFYLSDVIDADTSQSVTITYMNVEKLVTKLIVEYGQKAKSVSLPTDNGKLFIWFNGDVAYDFNEKVTDNLVLNAKWFITSEVGEDLADNLDKTQNELENTKSELDKTKTDLNDTKAELDETKSNLEDTKAELDKTKSDLDDTKSELNGTKSDLAETKTELGETQSQLNNAQNNIEALNGNLNSATENIDKLNDKLSSVTAWMIVSIVLFVLSCGAIVTLVLIFNRKKNQ